MRSFKNASSVGVQMGDGGTVTQNLLVKISTLQ